MTDCVATSGALCPCPVPLPAVDGDGSDLSPDLDDGITLLPDDDQDTEVSNVGRPAILAGRQHRVDALWRWASLGGVAMLALVASAVLSPSAPALADAVLGDRIPVGTKPGATAANPATNRIYVTNLDSNSVSVIDGTTNTVIGQPIAVGANPGGVAVNPRTNRVYVTNSDSSSVSVIDGATNTVIGNPIAIPRRDDGLSAHPFGTAVNTTTNRIYVGNAFVDSVSVIDGATNTLIGAPIPVEQTPVGVAINQITNRVYVTSQTRNKISVIDGASNTVIGTPIPVTQLPQGIAVNSATNRIYVASFINGNVTVIDGATNDKVGSAIELGTNLGLGLDLNPDTGLLYVSAFSDNKVAVIDTATNTLIGPAIPVGAHPGALAVNPATNQVYVPLSDANAVAAIGVPLAITPHVTPTGLNVTATWSSLLVPRGGDFVGLFAPGAANASPLSKRFTNGTAAAGGPGVAAGSVDLSIPAGLTAGNYEIRLISGAGDATLAQVRTTLVAAANDTFTVSTGTTLTVPAPGVLANDSTGSPGGGAPLQASVVTKPAHGALTLQPTGGFIYVPEIFFAGTDSFTYQVAAGSGLPATATATIAVTTGPIGANDAFSVASGSVLNVPAPGVLANDSDPDSPSLQVAVATTTSHGPLTLRPDGGFTYTPAAGFSGPDSFTYRITDGTSVSQAVTVTLTVTLDACAPRPPVKVTTAVSAGKLNAHLQAGALNTQQPNALKALQFGALQNAKVTFNGQAVASGQAVTLPASSNTADFTVERATPGQPTTVPLTVIDSCGEWKTLVGGGTGTGF